MESSQSCLSCTPALVMSTATGTEEEKVKFSLVDPFLLEALENPRHRLTVLRMELDIQKFLQSSDQCQFEFQYFPTSYLRCAAHRVAQHYGLQTLVVENATDVSGSRIVARKTPEIRYPAICLSEIPTKKHENEKTGHIKIVTRPRPTKLPLVNTEGWGAGPTCLRWKSEKRNEKLRSHFNGSFWC
ncbi:hypothetical protein HPP92_000048 [Vanilla planifolia]|uniref:R3H domain-containing protein n=1 Tax=Vanilla planifolia TaxID=51239 RepID=A0A835S0I5_VANPL|nr:hypothetical protein HPP92_000048 [Vanilla planifolia]